MAKGESKKVKTYGEGRKCAQPGCGKPLSIYNPGDRCHCHGLPPEYKTSFFRPSSIYFGGGHSGGDALITQMKEDGGYVR